MFQSEITPEQNGNIQKVLITQDGDVLSFGQVFELWRDNKTFRDFYTSLLKNAPFEAFRWETPPVSTENQHEGYEFVILNSPYLPNSANPNPFREFFQEPGKNEGVVVFPNLGKDAVLIVPMPECDVDTYAHMAPFLRNADDDQIQALWMAVGEAVCKHISSRRWLWINTAGGGVSWLHVRLDSRPKYYQYGPYRELE